MNLILKSLRKINSTCRKSGIAGLAILMAAGLNACTDDVLPNENNSTPIDSSLSLVDLPGVFGIDLSHSDLSTRADNASPFADASTKFDDGLGDEFELVAKDGNEFYHYLLLFDANNANLTPQVFPIEGYETVRDQNSTNNLTLTISKVFKMAEDGPFENIHDANALKSLLTDKLVYVLLNFKLDSNFKLADKTFTGTTTAAKLKELTRNELEQLQMTSYKVRGKKTTTNSNGESVTTEKDFFIMSSSVYSNGTARVVAGSADPKKIFSTEDDAKANPAISAYVERLASKITVSFDLTKIAGKNFGPVNDNYPVAVSDYETDGLPLLTTQVNRVNMDEYADGISFSNDGYKIETVPMIATIKILGFALNNLESSTFLYKHINSTSTTDWTTWNDAPNYRSYWALDEHYGLEAGNKALTFKKVLGYPHQFRQALDTDSVTSVHAGGVNGYTGNEQDNYRIDGTEYESYSTLGEIDLTKKIEGLYLQYKPFTDLIDDFTAKKLRFSRTVANNTNLITFDPVYSLENTYFDQGMISKTGYRWGWQRAPYATATNLMVFAQIDLKDNNSGSQVAGGDDNSGDPEVLTRDGETLISDEGYDPSVRTVYLGQNNIFYLRKVNLLKSKLAILNQVMLSGGNAGIQILNGLWDRHQTVTTSSKDPILDKVGWNEKSVLWFAKVEWDDEAQGPKYDKKVDYDEEGNEIISYDIHLLETHKVFIDNGNNVSDDTPQYLDLVPAEISGGDGQRLIAPHQNYMGSHWRYYLAPEAEGSTDESPLMDKKYAVEISYNHLVALIHKIIGPVDVYRNGLMYYSVPIPHRISEYSSTKNTDGWKLLGNFSLVRNNWYNITINEFTRLGTPIDVLEQPIVPVMDVKRSYINMGVELKNWHDIIQDNIPMM